MNKTPIIVLVVAIIVLCCCSLCVVLWTVVFWQKAQVLDEYREPYRHEQPYEYRDEHQPDAWE
jgi:hypothetical protein